MYTLNLGEAVWKIQTDRLRGSASASKLAKFSDSLLHVREAKRMATNRQAFMQQTVHRWDKNYAGRAWAPRQTAPVHVVTVPLPVIIVDGGPSAGKCHMYSQAARCTPPLA